MARVSKPPAERRDELLDAATRLCASVGYESLSIDQLTRDVGVAKGTFYYHFPTKTDMLIALVQRYIDDLFIDLEATALTLRGTGQERFRALMMEATNWKTSRASDALTFIPLLYKPENMELRHRLFDSWIARTRDVFGPLVRLGDADGSLDLPPDADPEITTDLVMSLWLNGSTTFFDRALAADTPEEFATILVHGIQGLSTAVERLLGATPGSFHVPYDASALIASHALFMAALHGGTPATETHVS